MRIPNEYLRHLESVRHTGWFAVTKSGLLELEKVSVWNPKSIVLLGLRSGGRIFTLPEGKAGYFQSKTASSSPGAGTELESRNIGYREGNLEIVLRVKEGSFECSLEAGEISNA